MAIWQILLIALGCSIIILILIGLFLRKKIEVSRHIDIHASPDQIFPLINNMRNFVKWSPWTEKDPEMLMRFSETPYGTGATYEWKGNKKVKTGSMVITRSEENKEVVTELKFGHDPKPATSGWRLEPHGDATQVTWYFQTEIKNPLGRYFGLFMDRFIGPDFEQGLTNLKVAAELDESQLSSNSST